MAFAHIWGQKVGQRVAVNGQFFVDVFGSTFKLKIPVRVEEMANGKTAEL